ncbi:MAG TPA: DUF1573 domain-containing protein [Saprospiraceae bacterium]|nr:DUF1573 domain-containing protein [Saprospiraceae bacterium]
MTLKTVAITLFSALLLASCNTVSSKDKEIREAAKEKLTNPTTSQNSRINKNNDNKVVVTGPTTKIQFKQTQYNFGTINEGEKAKHSYQFTNVGTEPLIIQDAKASCGCTVPTYSKDPVAPGETGQIDVVFDSKGRPGKTSKYVTITANTEPVKTKVFLTGEVKPKKKK